MSLKRGLKLNILPAAFVICGVFLLSFPVNKAFAYHSTSTYLKPYNGTLSASEWNNLLYDNSGNIFGDFVNTWLPAKMNGPLGIATSSPDDNGVMLDVNGVVRATGFIGPMSGTVSARNVSAGEFGFSTGGGNYLFAVNNPGNIGIGTISPSAQLTQKSTTALESAPLGSELLSSSNWTSTGWSGDFASGFTHSTGNTTALTNTLAAVSGNYYQIAFTVTGRTAGTFTVTFGGVTSAGYSATGTFGPKATSTGTLSITPTSDFNGTIVLSIKQITGTYNATYAIQDSTGANSFEIRNGLASRGNNFIGLGAGRYNTTGNYNSAQGVNSLYSNTTGINNSAQGYASLYYNTAGINNSAQGIQSLYSNTTGSYNSAQGVNSLYSNTTGNYNSAQGYASLLSNTTGNYNSAQGYASLYFNTTGNSNSAQGMYSLFSNTTGSFNSAIGYRAGHYIADGSTANTTGDYNLFLGVNTKALADNDQNEIVIGYNAIGQGSNSVVLGNTDISKTILRGYVGIGTTTPAANLDVNGLIKMRSSTIIANEDVINKGYLDSAIALATSSVITQVATSSFWQGSLTGNVWNANSGNIGIGTTTPGAILHLSSAGTADTLLLTGGDGLARMKSTSNFSFSTLSPTGTLYFAGGNNGTIQFGSSGNYKLIINNVSGNVGIGTSSPAARLEVSSNSSQIRISRTDAPLYYTEFVEQYNASYPFYINANNYGRLMGYKQFIAGDQPIAFMSGYYGVALATYATDPTASHVRLYINQTGNVGIGTTAPNDIFSIGNSGAAAPAGSANTGHNYTSTYSSSDDYALTNYGLVKSLISAATSSSALWGGTTGGNIWSLNSGNVGVGTTAPGAKLDLFWGTGVGPGVRLQGGNGVFENTALQLVDTGTASGNTNILDFAFTSSLYSGARIKAINVGDSMVNGAKLVLETASNNSGTWNSNQLVLNNNGNVGIGTANPTWALQIENNSGYAGIQIKDTRAGGKFASLGAGSAGSAFSFDKSGYFSIYGAAGTSDSGTFPANYYKVFGSTGNTLIGNNSHTTVDTNYKLNINAVGSAGYFAITNSSNGDIVKVDSAGNVGIGTTAPNDIFSIGNSGTAPAGSANTGHNYTSTYSSSDDYALTNYGLVKSLISAATSSSALWGGTVGGNIWNLNTSGNVGIGTTAPGAPLEIQSALDGIFRLRQTGGGWNYIEFYNDSARQAYFGLNSANDFQFSPVSGRIFMPSSGLTIGYSNSYNPPVSGLIVSGNVGIGTTTPRVALDVNGGAIIGGAGIGKLVVGDNTAGTGGYNFSIDANNGAGPQLQLGYRDNPTGYFTFGSMGGRNLINTMSRDFAIHSSSKYISGGGILFLQNTTGNVGIGITAPNDIFSIGNAGTAAPAGSANTGHNYTSTYSSSDDYALTNYGLVKSLISAATSSSALWGGTTGGNIWSLNSGNVGIGTTNPGAYKLNVNGNTNITGNLIASNYQTRNFVYSYGPMALDANNYLFTLATSGNGDANYATINFFESNSGQYREVQVVVKNSAGVNTVFVYPLNSSGGGAVNAEIRYMNRTADSKTTDFYITRTGVMSYTQLVEIYGSRIIKDLANAEWSALTSVVLDSNLHTSASGNVGIGTVNPGVKLEVNSEASVGVGGSLPQARFFGGSTVNNDFRSGQIVLGRNNNIDASLSWNNADASFYIDNRYNNDLGGIRFRTKTSGTPVNAMAITGVGNVGIGTITPLDSFSIGNAGTAAPAGSANTGHNYTSTYSSSDDYALTNYGLVKSLISAATSSSALWGGTVGGAIWNLNSGNVGIGTTNPNALLHLSKGTGDQEFIKLQNTGDTIGDKVHLIFNMTSNVAGKGAEIVAERLGANAQSALEFYTNTTGGASTERMRIDQYGNVGIGTTAPGSKLEISGPTYNQPYLRFSVASDHNRYSQIKLNGAQNQGFIIDIDPLANSAYDAFSINMSSTTAFYIDSVRNVGIGTTAPNDSFSIGNAGTAAPAGASNTGHNYTSTYTSDDDYALANYGLVKSLISAATSSSALWGGTTGGNIWNLNTSGNVGIGTTNPGSKLTVRGADDKDTGPILNLSGNLANQLESGRVRFTETTVSISPFYQGAFFHYDGSNNVFNIGVHEAVDALQASDINSIRITRSNGNVNIGNSALFAQYNGNVGIGTTAPGAKLDVGGVFRFTNSGVLNWGAGSSNGTLTWDTGYAKVASQGANILKLYSGVGGSGIDIISGGNVGIGTTAPLDSFSIGNAGLAAPAGASNTGHNYTNTYLSTDDYALTNYGIVRSLINAATSTIATSSLWFGTKNGNIWNGDAGAGNVGIGTTAPSAQLTQKSIASLESASLGSELLSSSGWSSTDWSGDFAGGFTHSTGNTTTLTNSFAAVAGNLYQIAFTVTGRTAGSFYITFGGASSVVYSATNAFGPKAVNTGSLVITPSSDFNGTITISIKQINSPYGAVYAIQDSTGANSFEIRNNLASLRNTFIGYGSGRYNTTGSSNSAQGFQALFSNTTGTSNSVQGYAAMYSNTAGSYNSAQGQQSLYSNTTGNYNTAQGMYSLYSNTTGGSNSAQGMYSLYLNTTGNYNTAQGYQSLYTNTTGYNNSAQGFQSLLSNTTGANNTAQGYSSLYSNTTGNNNSALGIASLYLNTTGSFNSAVGRDAGRYIADGSTGRSTGDYGLYLGYNSRASANGMSNEIVIGYNAIGQGSNSVVLGNDSILKTILKGNVGIGTTAPLDKFSIGDNAGLAAPAGSANTGHNYTNTYLSTDDYALVNYGIVKTLIDAATSSSALWGGTTGGAIWNLNSGNIGIGTTTPASALQVEGIVTALGFSGPLLGSVNAANVTSGIFGNNYGGGTYSFGGLPTMNDGSSANNIYYSSTGSHNLTAPQLIVRQDDAETSIVNTKVALDIHNDDGGQNTYSTLAFSSREASGAGNSVALAGISGWKISAGTANAWSQGGLKFWVKDNGTLNEAMTINQAGNVGIGTSNPDVALDVFGAFHAGKNASSPAYRYVEIKGDNVNGLIQARRGDTDVARDLIMQYAGGNVGIGTTNPGAFKLKVAGDVAITGALLTQTGSDFAEEFKAPTALEPGTVVVMGDEGYKSVKPCSSAYDKTVVGIVSDNPSIIAGRTDADKKNPEKVVVAMMGVVKVKVSNINGRIEKGDLLTTSDTKGYAMRAESDKQGTIIGKALEDLNTKTGEIKVLVNLQ